MTQKQLNPLTCSNVIQALKMGLFCVVMISQLAIAFKSDFSYIYCKYCLHREKCKKVVNRFINGKRD